MGQMRIAYSIFVGRPKVMRQARMHRVRWEDNIKMEFKEIGCENVDSWDSVEGPVARAFVNTVMNIRVP
jgi:hypothetical protein